MKTLNFIIKPSGEVTVDAQGYTDAGCKADTAPILEALTGGEGHVTTEDKSEAHIPASGSATISGY
jgi:hypothetical protein